MLKAQTSNESFPSGKMAATKKYAGLPDLDLGTEIYETVPELTEGSTVDQSSTVRTESPTPSEAENPNLDRQRFDRDSARRRFEPATIDARDVNFSDTVSGNRRDYKSGHRRRRRRKTVHNGDEEYTALSEDSEDETLKGRLTRLKREAEEVKAEIERMEREKDHEDAEFKDSVEQQAEEDGQDLVNDVQQLDQLLSQITVSHHVKQGRTLEQHFMKSLNGDSRPRLPRKLEAKSADSVLTSSSISAIAAFSDRLTALEAALGVSTIHSDVSSPSIIPELETLSTQIEILSTTLTPSGSQTLVGNSNTTHLDNLSNRLKLLISESKRLEDSRKAAAKSLEELLEARDRHASFFHGTTTSVPASRGDNKQQVQVDGTKNAPTATKELTHTLFLDEQAAKITALYNLIPTIQSLQPLLPTVLERLRALSVVHAGAADTKGEMDEIENRLAQWERDLEKWREAVQSVESGMEEGREVMKENVEVIGGRVREIEQRMKLLEKPR